MRLFPLLLVLGLAACSGGNAPVPAKAHADATTSTTVGGATLQTSTVALADLNAAVATRYGIDPGDLQLTGTGSVLPDPPKPLELRAVQTDGMTDYLAVVQARAPATVAFKLTAVRGGSRADIATTAELQPR